MEALAAISLAGNIIQFVDFGQRLVSKARDFYGSTTSSLTIHEEIENLTSDLSRFCGNLSASNGNLPSACVSQAERDLLDLVAPCQTLASEFSTLLHKLKAQTRNSKWTSLRQALKSLWNERTVNEYVRRLDNYRNQVNLRLLNLLT